MKTRTVKRTSIFQSSKSEVFALLQDFATLNTIARPYITFKPVNAAAQIRWQEGETFVFKAKLLGFIPFGTHTINVVDFSEAGRIYTNETNTYVPVWNHEIILKEIGENNTAYTDEVEIFAGWKTYFVYLWASLFYRHRQKKWIKILAKKL